MRTLREFRFLQCVFDLALCEQHVNFTVADAVALWNFFELDKAEVESLLQLLQQILVEKFAQDLTQARETLRLVRLLSTDLF